MRSLESLVVDALAATPVIATANESAAQVTMAERKVRLIATPFLNGRVPKFYDWFLDSSRGELSKRPQRREWIVNTRPTTYPPLNALRD
jgi:hypothetical protein